MSRWQTFRRIFTRATPPPPPVAVNNAARFHATAVGASSSAAMMSGRNVEYHSILANPRDLLASFKSTPTSSYQPDLEANRSSSTSTSTSSSSLSSSSSSSASSPASQPRVADQEEAISYLEQLRKKLPSWNRSTWMMIGGVGVFLVGATGAIMGGIALTNAVGAGAFSAANGGMMSGAWLLITDIAYFLTGTLAAVLGGLLAMSGYQRHVIETLIPGMYERQSEQEKIIDNLKSNQSGLDEANRRSEKRISVLEAQLALVLGRLNAVTSAIVCSVCQERSCNRAVQGCGHTFCSQCLSHPSITNCPQCRQPIEATANVVLPHDHVAVPIDQPLAHL